MSENAFEDLLGGHSFSGGRKEPKTMKELRKNMDVRDMDPDQRKVLSVTANVSSVQLVVVGTRDELKYGTTFVKVISDRNSMKVQKCVVAC